MTCAAILRRGARAARLRRRDGIRADVRLRRPRLTAARRPPQTLARRARPRRPPRRRAREAPRLVGRRTPRAPLALPAGRRRPVPRLARRGDAAADAGGGGRAVLPALRGAVPHPAGARPRARGGGARAVERSEEHTSELHSRE